MKKRANFFRHLHPPMIRQRTLQPSSTLGLGIVCLTCFLVLVATGVTLLLYYMPYQEAAYDRILHIVTTLRYGRLIRNLHFLAANVLIVAAISHLARVFFMGSYQGRWLNWTYGLILLSLVFFSNYTGYILPWDQTSYWAIKVGSNLAAYIPGLGPSFKSFLLGGEDISQETLVRSLALHVSVLPFLWSILISLHLWRIRKDGGLAAPEDESTERLPSSPWLFRAELTAGLFTLSLLLSLAFFIDAPLSSRADPLHPPNPAKAPWYFVGIQEMVSYSATLGGVVIPVLIGVFLFFAPFLDRNRQAGIWFGRGRLTLNLLLGLILLSQVLMIVVGQWLRTKNWVFKFPW
ncbi:MAG: cytochrome bc complex cytochrome b subunit [Deltaproteobacteria bacterium]|nr:cytochrome bc complex cytochrome b subunit [Deltaproteobacteria bacterium]